MANSGSTIPVGLFAQTLSHALFDSKALGPRCVADIMDGSQFSDEAQDIREDENLALVREIAPNQATAACPSQLLNMSQPH